MAASNRCSAWSRGLGFGLWLAAGALPMETWAQDTADAEPASADEAAEAEEAAQPAPPAAPTRAQIAEAREAFELGETLFQEGDYQGAADLFREAYAAVPDPTLLFRIGDALQRAEDYRGAGEAYEEYLRRRPEAPDREDVEARLDGIRQVPGLITVTTTPAGATVTVDGDAYEGVTPLDIQVAPGQHLVTATLEDYAPAFQEIEVGYDQEVEVALALELAPEEPEDAMGAATGPVVPAAGAAEGEDAPEFHPSAGVWIATGVAAAALATGTVFGFLAMDRQSDFDGLPSTSVKDEGETFALVADLGFGLAAAAGITAIALYFIERNAFDSGSESSSNDDTAGLDLTITPAVGPHGGGVAAQLRF